MYRPSGGAPLYPVAEVALTLQATLAAGLAWKNGHPWDDVRKAVVDGIASALPAIFILFAVGVPLACLLWFLFHGKWYRRRLLLDVGEPTTLQLEAGER